MTKDKASTTDDLLKQSVPIMDNPADSDISVRGRTTSIAMGSMDPDLKDILKEEAKYVKEHGPYDSINELIQNANRAGSTMLDFDIRDDGVTYRNNGTPITDEGVMLTFFKFLSSGWSTEVRARTKPKGRGFLTNLVLFGRIKVTSGRWTIDFDWKGFLRTPPGTRVEPFVNITAYETEPLSGTGFNIMFEFLKPFEDYTASAYSEKLLASTYEVGEAICAQRFGLESEDAWKARRDAYLGSRGTSPRNMGFVVNGERVFAKVADRPYGLSHVWNFRIYKTTDGNHNQIAHGWMTVFKDGDRYGPFHSAVEKGHPMYDFDSGQFRVIQQGGQAYKEPFRIKNHESLPVGGQIWVDDDDSLPPNPTRDHIIDGAKKNWFCKELAGKLKDYAISMVKSANADTLDDYSGFITGIMGDDIEDLGKYINWNFVDIEVLGDVEALMAKLKADTPEKRNDLLQKILSNPDSVAAMLTMVELQSAGVMPSEEHSIAETEHSLEKQSDVAKQIAVAKTTKEILEHVQELREEGGAPAITVQVEAVEAIVEKEERGEALTPADAEVIETVKTAALEVAQKADEQVALIDAKRTAAQESVVVAARNWRKIEEPEERPPESTEAGEETKKSFAQIQHAKKAIIYVRTNEQAQLATQLDVLRAIGVRVLIVRNKVEEAILKKLGERCVHISKLRIREIQNSHFKKRGLLNKEELRIAWLLKKVTERTVEMLSPNRFPKEGVARAATLRFAAASIKMGVQSVMVPLDADTYEVWHANSWRAKEKVLEHACYTEFFNKVDERIHLMKPISTEELEKNPHVAERFQSLIQYITSSKTENDYTNYEILAPVSKTSYDEISGAMNAAKAYVNDTNNSERNRHAFIIQRIYEKDLAVGKEREDAAAVAKILGVYDPMLNAIVFSRKGPDFSRDMITACKMLKYNRFPAPDPLAYPAIGAGDLKALELLRETFTHELTHCVSQIGMEAAMSHSIEFYEAQIAILHAMGMAMVSFIGAASISGDVSHGTMTIPAGDLVSLGVTEGDAVIAHISKGPAKGAAPIVTEREPEATEEQATNQEEKHEVS